MSDTAALPVIEHEYDAFIFNSTRWRGFTPRAGDIMVCTSYKAGTTWTQMICALLIHQKPELPGKMGEFAPWLDMKLESAAAVIGRLEAQDHRRMIKTHTPLDGLPYYPEASYVFCGRDPRDVFMSMQSHMANMNWERIAELLIAQGEDFSPPPPPPDDYNVRFAAWISMGANDWEQDGFPFWSHVRHCETFWRFRHLPNIHFLHYADLKADLEGQMRRLAGLLNITVPEEKWPELVEAATFTSMKANADQTAPDTHSATWKSNSAFFAKGQNAQWRGVLSDEMLAEYDRLMRGRYDNRMLDWLEQGSLATAYPD